MNEATLNVFLVISKARNPPEVDNSADAKIDDGAENVWNSKSRTINRRSSAEF
jgi:hypothetical protein